MRSYDFMIEDLRVPSALVSKNDISLSYLAKLSHNRQQFARAKKDRPKRLFRARMEDMILIGLEYKYRKLVLIPCSSLEEVIKFESHYEISRWYPNQQIIPFYYKIYDPRESSCEFTTYFFAKRFLKIVNGWPESQVSNLYTDIFGPRCPVALLNQNAFMYVNGLIEHLDKRINNQYIPQTQKQIFEAMQRLYTTIMLEQDYICPMCLDMDAPKLIFTSCEHVFCENCCISSPQCSDDNCAESPHFMVSLPLQKCPVHGEYDCTKAKIVQNNFNLMIDTPWLLEGDDTLSFDSRITIDW